MSFCTDGLDCKLESATIEISVASDHSLIRLANTINWNEIYEITKEDLKKTEKNKWWLGRKLKLRIHIAVYLLQLIFKMTDRALEEAIIGNAYYQMFCGKTIVKRWHCPDHTKIEEFRNRLSPESGRKTANYIAQLAEELGFADSSKMDVDSTVQEANIAYPSDANLLVKLGKMSLKVAEYLKTHATGISSRVESSVKKKVNDLEKYFLSNMIDLLNVNIKEIKDKAKAYFFLSKNVPKEKKYTVFKELYQAVKEQVLPIIQVCTSLNQETMNQLPWNVKRTVEQIRQHAKKYLKDVAYFIKTGKMKPGKILSFHAQEVACIVKGKIGKAMEFGRVFQLGRIGGNFFIGLSCNTVRMEDKQTLIPMVKEHEKIFGVGKLNSLCTDKGYYTNANVKYFKEKIKELGMQVPGNVKTSELKVEQKLINRRAGIEPLIGHVKKFGLGKSKMKSDESTKTSGYRSIAGFNLHQLIRSQTAAVKEIGNTT